MLNLLKIRSIGRKQESTVNVNVYMHFGVWQQVTGVVVVGDHREF